MKILVSWHAYLQDYNEGSVLEDGPTISFHRYFFKHEKHIILSAKKTRKISALYIYDLI